MTLTRSASSSRATHRRLQPCSPIVRSVLPIASQTTHARGGSCQSSALRICERSFSATIASFTEFEKIRFKSLQSTMELGRSMLARSRVPHNKAIHPPVRRDVNEIWTNLEFLAG